MFFMTMQYCCYDCLVNSHCAYFSIIDLLEPCMYLEDSCASLLPCFGFSELANELHGVN